MSPVSYDSQLTWNGQSGSLQSPRVLLLLPPLGPPVLEPHLDARLGQVDPEGQLLAEEHVGVVGLVEGPLQLLQLVVGEGRPVSALLPLGRAAAHLFVALPRVGVIICVQIK
jgi:hypothetical protein